MHPGAITEGGSRLPGIPRRTQLYVPGNNRKFLEKASGLSVDSLIFDLEDSVPYPEKANARKLIREYMGNAEFKSKETCVRINSLSDPEGEKDIEFLSSLDGIDTIVVSKAENRLDRIHRTTGKQLIPLIESPVGMINMEETARSEGVAALAWAAGDLAALTDARVSAYERNPYILTSISLVAHAYGVEAIDKVYFEVDNIRGLLEEASVSRKYGFTGKQIIHPTHIEPVQKVFSPDEEEIRWAEKVISALGEKTAGKRGAVRLNGNLIDLVHVRMAERILGRAGRDLPEDDDSDET